MSQPIVFQRLDALDASDENIVNILTEAQKRGQVGNAAGSQPVGQDVNTYTTAGIYYFASGHGAVNWPHTYPGFLFVYSNAPSTILFQDVVRGSPATEEAVRGIWRRKSDSSGATWSLWYRVDSYPLELRVAALEAGEGESVDLTPVLTRLTAAETSISGLQAETTAKWVILNNLSVQVNTNSTNITALSNSMGDVAAALAAFLRS